MSQIKSYTEKYNKRITLRNGREAFLRPIQDKDAQLLLELLKSCSYDTLFFRFMSSSIYINLKKGNSSAVLNIIKSFCCIDFENLMSIIASVSENNKEILVSWGMYVITAPNRAEIAILTGDNWQRLGLATQIGEFMMEIAKSKGIKFFEGDILLSNEKLLRLMNSLKINYNKVIKHGALRFEIDLDNPFYE